MRDVNIGLSEGCQKTVSDVDSNIFIVEEDFSYAAKTHPHLRDIPKENSFTSTISGSSGAAEVVHVKALKIQNLCGIFGLCLAFGVCLTGCYVMWATDLFTHLVHQNLIISNNSLRYEAWKTPPVHAFLRVYIFNYSNVIEFESGRDAKLKIQELGPYTYVENWERVDVKFNENGTATYRDKRIYRYSPEHSAGKESDIILVPNVPFLSALSLMKDMPYVIQWPFSRLIKAMGVNPFIRLNASDFLWGYDDGFSKLAQNVLSFRYNLPFEKFGILSAKNGTQKDLVTIYTGEADSSKTGIVESYDGKTALNYWNSDECNRIDGTDGTIYPPAMIHANSTLYIYSKDLCRKMPLIYNTHYEDKHGIPVMRFRVPESVFASGLVQKENLCFCNRIHNENKCLPSGIFNVGPCAFEAPLVTSLPHFLYGDSILTRGMEGLKPAVDKHETFVEVDPNMGIPVGGKSRLQLNIMLSKSSLYGSTQKNAIYNNQVLFPITWMDYGVDRLPDEVSSMIRSLLTFIKVAQLSLSYGFVICAIAFGLLVANGCRQIIRIIWVSPGRLYRKETSETQSESPFFVIQDKR